MADLLKNVEVVVVDGQYLGIVQRLRGTGLWHVYEGLFKLDAQAVLDKTYRTKAAAVRAIKKAFLLCKQRNEEPVVCGKVHIGSVWFHEGHWYISTEGAKDLTVSERAGVSSFVHQKRFDNADDARDYLIAAYTRVQLRPGEQRKTQVIRFKCKVCGKVTAGRVPRNPHNHREKGDGTFRYPRLHWADGKVCPGCYEEAEWVYDSEEDDDETVTS